MGFPFAALFLVCIKLARGIVDLTLCLFAFLKGTVYSQRQLLEPTSVGLPFPLYGKSLIQSLSLCMILLVDELLFLSYARGVSKA